MARQRFCRSVERKSPAVVVCLGKRLGGAVSFKRLVKFLLRLELLYHELASRKVEKRKPKAVDCGGVVVHRLVEKPVFSDGARGYDARDFAADEPLRKLRVLDLVAERGSLPRPDELREIAVERVVGNAAHRLVPAVRQRRAEDWRGDNRVLAEHLVEVAEAKHQYRARRHLAFQREVLPLHRCKLVGHREAKTRTCKTGSFGLLVLVPLRLHALVVFMLRHFFAAFLLDGTHCSFSLGCLRLLFRR